MSRSQRERVLEVIFAPEGFVNLLRKAPQFVFEAAPTVIAEAPKLAPHIPAMRQRIAQALGVALDQVSVKAKTAEGMGPVGRREAMEARAVCLVSRS